MSDHRTATLISRAWTVAANASYDVAGMPDVPRAGLATLRPEILTIVWKDNRLESVKLMGFQLDGNGTPTRRPAAEWFSAAEATNTPTDGPSIPAPDWVQEIVRHAKMPTSAEDVITRD